MGIAVGCIGMSFDDFCGYDFDEFEAICKSWQGMTEGRMHDAWERMRISAAINIQPHVKGKMTPEKLLPLPWDNKRKSRDERPEITRAEDKKRFDTLVSKLG